MQNINGASQVGKARRSNCMHRTKISSRFNLFCCSINLSTPLPLAFVATWKIILKWTWMKREICFTNVQGVRIGRRPGLGWLWFESSTIWPSCPATSAKFPSAREEFGRQGNSQNPINPTQVYDQLGRPVFSELESDSLLRVIRIYVWRWNNQINANPTQVHDHQSHPVRDHISTHFFILHSHENGELDVWLAFECVPLVTTVCPIWAMLIFVAVVHTVEGEESTLNN